MADVGSDMVPTVDAGTERLQHAVWVASPFVEQVGLFERWVAAHGRLPLWDTDDRLEKSMWRWVSGCRQRRIDGRLDVELEERLAALPGWSWVPSRGPRAVAKQRRSGRPSAVRLDDSLIAELVEWIRLNGRVPGYGKAGTREARMAAAARRLRKAKQAGRLPHPMKRRHEYERDTCDQRHDEPRDKPHVMI